MKRLLFANLKAYHKIGIRILICVSLLGCSMHVLSFVLFQIQAGIRANHMSLYGEQHAVLFDVTAEKQSAIGNWMGALEKIGYLTSFEQPVRIDGQSIRIGSFDSQAWDMGRLQIIEGGGIERPNHVLVEEKIRSQLFPHIKVGEAISLPPAASPLDEHPFVLAGVVRNYTSIWEEVYSKWPPTSCLFPNLIVHRDRIAEAPATVNALVTFQPRAANRILQENNAFLKELGVQWARNEKTYQEQWREDQAPGIQRMIEALPILTLLCMGACILYLCNVMMRAHSDQFKALMELGVPFGAIIGLYFAECCFWLAQSLVIGLLAGMAFATLLGVATLGMSWIESAGLTAEALPTLLAQNLLHALWAAVVSFTSLFMYLSRSGRRDFKPPHPSRFQPPAIVLLAWRLFRKNLFSYLSGILCIGVGLSVFLHTGSLVRETVDASLPHVPDYVISVLSNSEVVPYGKCANLPVHVGAYRSLSQDLIHALRQLGSVEKIDACHTSYDWILLFPNQAIEGGDKWMYYDMDPHYAKDAYTYRRAFLNHFTTKRALIEEAQEAFIGEYQATRELGMLGLDWENNEITTGLLQACDDLTWDGKADLIPCRMEIAKSHAPFLMKPGSVIEGVYYQYVGDTDALSMTTVLSEADHSNIVKAHARFAIQEVILSEKEDTPIVLYLPHEMFSKYDQAGSQKVEIFLHPNQSIDEVDRLATAYKEANPDTVYMENRVEQASQRQRLRQRLLTTASVVNALLALSGGFQLYFCFSAHLKSRKKQLLLYHELGLGETECWFIKYSDLAFSGLLGLACGIVLLLLLKEFGAGIHKPL